MENSGSENDWINNSYSESELVVGLVGAVGTNLSLISNIIRQRLSHYQYSTEEIRISKHIIQELYPIKESTDACETINQYMTGGNALREKTGDYSVLALAAAAKINHYRCELNKSCGDEDRPLKKYAFIINSLKTPDEIKRLRNIYSDGFFLIGVHSDRERRSNFLRDNLNITNTDDREKLIERDEDESFKYGQHTRDTFQFADFFINVDGDIDKLNNDIWRIISLMFGMPYITPTFDEFAMFMAFSSSLRSADLSRQVGAVIAKDCNIVSTGANDVPKAQGGLYWPIVDKKEKKIIDIHEGRDYMRGFDSNAREKQKIINEILNSIPAENRDQIIECLQKSKIKDITEYGRVVHAEMEAILACSRNGIKTKQATLYCTTFPCHNCAKHIIAAGLKRVVYIEPYPKSKAFDFHSDSISTIENEDSVLFEPFVGVGPRNFFNLFSMNFGNGYPLKRKNKDGTSITWGEDNRKLRMQMLPCSYLEREKLAANLLFEYLGENQ